MVGLEWFNYDQVSNCRISMYFLASSCLLRPVKVELKADRAVPMRVMLIYIMRSQWP